MTEIEQLRKEVNELRERLAKLEARQNAAPPFTQRPYIPNVPQYPLAPPWTITCGVPTAARD